MSTSVMQERLVYGCMRIAGDGSRAVEKNASLALQTAIEAGFRLFDHADIYGDGACELLFGKFLQASPLLKDKIRVLTKCGIRMAGNGDALSPKRYDFSASHLLASVERSLKRLQIDQIDTLLLHRPDYLAEYDEVARVFDDLYASGKVLNFGVSNYNVQQINALRSKVRQPVLVHQFEFSLANPGALDNGTLDQCVEHGIAPQAWSPLGGIAYGSAAMPNTLLAELQRQSESYGVPDWIVALAWILRHPAKVSPVIGSTRADRIASAHLALDIDYSRDDWYRLLESRRGDPVP